MGGEGVRKGVREEGKDRKNYIWEGRNGRRGKEKRRKGRRERGRMAETRNQGKDEIEGGGM